MMKISFRGNDAGSLAPAVAILSFMIVCLFLAFGACVERYAEFARKKEAAFRSQLEAQNGKVEEMNEND